MVRGGARVRSGPMPDPESGRSEHRGYRLSSLPNGGYQGDVPQFPLSTFRQYKNVKNRKVYDASASARWRKRELEIWGSLWRTPQALTRCLAMTRGRSIWGCQHAPSHQQSGQIKLQSSEIGR